jgi:hypothetical protein
LRASEPAGEILNEVKDLLSFTRLLVTRPEQKAPIVELLDFRIYEFEIQIYQSGQFVNPFSNSHFPLMLPTTIDDVWRELLYLYGSAS